jgi:hypothetical protein
MYYIVLQCFLTGNAKNTLGIQTTPEGVVKQYSIHTRGCCNNVFLCSAVSLPGIAKNTNGIQNTPEGDVRMHHIVLLFFYWAVQEKHTRHSKQHFSIHTAL